VDVAINGRVYTATAAVTYKGKSGKGVSFKK
jgi:hypothetical protein